jgi:adenine-specific DNA-methyltransferase
MPPVSRLTLSWIGKDKALLGTPGGGYEWVERDDPRVMEVRLLHEARAVGSLGMVAAADNLLINGDSHDALRALAYTPEYAAEYRGKVRQVYIDPPFNTGQAFADYDDALEHSVWLTMMRDRLKAIHELLAPNGTVWVHLDSTEVHRCRCLMDDEFGQDNYLGTVVWQRTTAKSLARRTMGTMHEQILVYGASEAAELYPLFRPLDEDYQASRFSNSDSRGQYDTGDLTAGSHRPHLDSGQPWRGFDPGTRRRCWAVPTNILLELGLTGAEINGLTMREKLDALDEAGFIHWPSKADGFPRYKKYLHRIKGRAIGDLWTDVNVINSQAGERTGFSTQKPEALLKRVFEMGSSPGDIVLDCFAGSGTTAAVAHKMQRRWVTIERETSTVEGVIAPRLERVVNGDDAGGVSEAVGWEKGGGFRVLTVGAPMYEMVDGRVFLAEWAAGTDFARAVCAQLGFFVQEEPPFAGRKGKSRLAVVDGVADTETVRALASRLGDGERVVIVAKAFSPDAEILLRDLSPGSRLRKAPRDLLQQRVVR